MIARFNIGTFTSNAGVDELYVTYDQYGNKFIGFEDIEQRIIMRSNNKDFRTLAPTDVSVAAMSDDVVIEKNNKNIPYSWKKYQFHNDMDKRYRWVNNIKNFNPMLLATRADDNGEYPPETYIMYLAIEYPRYKVLSYFTKYSILNTFNKVDKYNGCTIVFDADEHTNAEDDVIIEIKFFDTVTKVYRVCTITMDGNGNPEMNMRYADGPEVGKLKFLNSKFKSSFRIRIKPKPGSLLTQAYIYPITNPEYSDDQLTIANEKVEKMISEKATEFHPETNFYLIPISEVTTEGENDKPEYNREEIESALEEISEAKCTAITTFGINIPNDLIKKYHIRNIFNYDIATDKIYSKR
jgi:hypothetical protein